MTVYAVKYFSEDYECIEKLFDSIEKARAYIASQFAYSQQFYQIEEYEVED